MSVPSGSKLRKTNRQLTPVARQSFLTTVTQKDIAKCVISFPSNYLENLKQRLLWLWCGAVPYRAGGNYHVGSEATISLSGITCIASMGCSCPGGYDRAIAVNLGLCNCLLVSAAKFGRPPMAILQDDAVSCWNLSLLHLAPVLCPSPREHPFFWIVFQNM